MFHWPTHKCIAEGDHQLSCLSIDHYYVVSTPAKSGNEVTSVNHEQCHVVVVGCWVVIYSRPLRHGGSCNV